MRSDSSSGQGFLDDGRFFFDLQHLAASPWILLPSSDGDTCLLSSVEDDTRKKENSSSLDSSKLIAFLARLNYHQQQHKPTGETRSAQTT